MRKINQIEPFYDEREINSVTEYLKGGGWITEHVKTRELEDMIAQYVGSRFCSILPNGTLTLWAALAVLGVERGDEVIVPDFTMVASANAVRLAGAEPILVDIDPKTLCLDFESALQKITPKTKAIMLVSINGRCPEVEKFTVLCREKNIFLVEDAAQSLGSRLNGKHFGTFGTFGSFSFSMPKIITTGQGGALVTDDEEKHKILRKFKDFGRPNGGSDDYELMGFNLKFSDLLAVFGIEQMKKLDERVAQKKAILGWYREFLQDVPEVTFLETSDETSPWFIDILIADRPKLMSYLKENGIATRAFYPALHSLPFYRETGGVDVFPHSKFISERGLWLPSSVNLCEDDVRYISEIIKGFYR